MKKNALLIAGFFLALFLIAIAELGSVKLALANPYMYHKSVSAPVDPIITILSPESNTTYTSCTLTLNFKSVIDNKSAYDFFNVHIKTVYYQTSWQAGNVTLYKWSDNEPLYRDDDDPFIIEYSRKLILTGIPEGKQNVTVVVKGSGSYADGLTWCDFGTVGSETVNFIVDTTPPTVSVTLIMNEAYTEYEVLEIPLNFTVNESTSRISYVLDNNENVTIAGNTTLTNLSYGEHNVTVYATDDVGNTGASETITFTITAPRPQPEVFQTAPLAAASGALVAIVGVGLLVYFKKRKR